MVVHVRRARSVRRPAAGACYTSQSALGAFVEVFRDFSFVAESDVAARVLSRLRPPSDLKLADLTSPRARGFGVTAAIHSTSDYAATQAWAVALLRRRFDGVRYFCGHDPSPRAVGVAVFGTAGEAAWPVVDSGPVDDELLRSAERRFAIRALPAP